MSTRSIIQIFKEENFKDHLLVSLYKHWDGYPSSMGNGWWIYHFNKELMEKQKKARFSNYIDDTPDIGSDFIAYFQKYGRSEIEIDYYDDVWNADIEYLYWLRITEDNRLQLQIQHKNYLDDEPEIIFSDDVERLIDKFSIVQFSPKELYLLKSNSPDLTSDICRKILLEKPGQVEDLPNRFADYSLISNVVNRLKDFNIEYANYTMSRMPRTYIEEQGNNYKLTHSFTLSNEQNEILSLLANKDKPYSSCIDFEVLGKLDMYPYEFWRELIRLAPQYFRYMPLKYQDMSTVYTALREDGLNLAYVKQEFKDIDDICTLAIDHNPRACRYIGNFDKATKYRLLMNAFIKGHNDLAVIPQEMLDENFCIEAIKRNPLNMLLIPEKFKTYTLVHAVDIERRYTKNLTSQEKQEILAAIPAKFKDSDGRVLAYDQLPDEYKVKQAS